MIKLMALFKLREGIDPDELWKFWNEVHAPPHAMPGLTKYCINRVTKVVDGEPKYWGIAELWFESEEAQRKLLETGGKMALAMEAEKLLPGGGWFDRITDHDVVIMEEKVIVEDGSLVKG